MGIGLSLGAAAVGAVLAFAVTVSTPGISLPAVGAILMAVGFVGFATSLWLDYTARRGPVDRAYPAGRYDDPTAVDRTRY